jgi:hypothetical protein
MDDASLLRELRKLTNGLTFMSESDYPVKPFAPAAQGPQPRTAQEIIAAQKPAADASVTEREVDSFFNAAVQERAEQTPEAQATAKRFQALVKWLKENLSELKVYRVGGVEADVYVLGRTAAGTIAGVTTKVVET